MSRFLLDDEVLFKISEQLPFPTDIYNQVIKILPDFISIKFPAESTIPTTIVCLKDTLDVLSESQYALSEYFAHKIWYGEKCVPPNQRLVNIYGKFYLDDTAIRLYSAGEHLASAIEYMLEIDGSKLHKVKKEKRLISKQSVIGNYLLLFYPEHIITSILEKLIQKKEWDETITYRNTIVHEQPPAIKGSGITFNRSKRWKKLEPMEEGTLYGMGMGIGDEPKYSSIDELKCFILPAYKIFIDTINPIWNYYFNLLIEKGVTFNKNGQIELTI